MIWLSEILKSLERRISSKAEPKDEQFPLYQNNLLNGVESSKNKAGSIEHGHMLFSPQRISSKAEPKDEQEEDELEYW